VPEIYKPLSWEVKQLLLYGCTKSKNCGLSVLSVDLLQRIFRMVPNVPEDMTDVADDLLDEFPDADNTIICEPFRGLGLRLNSFRQACKPDAPVDAMQWRAAFQGFGPHIARFSLHYPRYVFVYVAAEYVHGHCEYKGAVFCNGKTICSEDWSDSGALRRLVNHLKCDIGKEEHFEPLGRDFPWEVSRRTQGQRRVPHYWSQSTRERTKQDERIEAARREVEERRVRRLEAWRETEQTWRQASHKQAEKQRERRESESQHQPGNWYKKC